MTTMRVVVIGVAGSGKTTVGERLAEGLGARYVEADSAHPPENIAKMSAGIPLTDEDRRPWLERLAAELAAGDPVVVTCSALKRRYRDVLRSAGSVRFVYLEIDRQLAADRMAPDETDVITIDASSPIPDLVARALAAIQSQRR
jgi:gluconokinase